MISYIHSAIQQALKKGPPNLNYNTCMVEAKQVWRCQYVQSNFAKKCEEDLERVFEKADLLFDKDWKAQYLLLSKDEECRKKCEHIYAKHVKGKFLTFRQVVCAFSDHYFAVYGGSKDYVIDLDDGPLATKLDDDWRVVPERVTVAFPNKATFCYFCTYLKDRWCGVENVPLCFRAIPLFHVGVVAEPNSVTPPPTLELQLHAVWSEGKWCLKTNPVLSCDNKKTVTWHDHTLLVGDNQRHFFTEGPNLDTILKQLPQPLFLT